MSGTTKGKRSLQSKIENECAKQRQNMFLKRQHNRFKGSKGGESEDLYLQVSMFFLQKMKWKTKRTLLSRFSSKSPFPSCLFSLLFPHNNNRMQERNSLYLLCFFLLSLSCDFLLFLCSFSLRFHHPFQVIRGAYIQSNISLFRKDLMY